MDDVEVVHGTCLHGRAIQVLGNAVYFVEGCSVCAPQLAAEGFIVVAGSRAFHAAA